MKVMKFGGGCLKDEKDFQKVVRLIAAEQDDKIVVISALFNVTDSLVEALQKIRIDESMVNITIKKLREKHEDLIKRAIGNKQISHRTLNSITRKIQHLERVLYGVAYTQELTDRTKALVLSFGERLAVLVLEGILQSHGIDAKALEADEIGIVTDSSFENATAILSTVQRNLGIHVIPLVKRKVVPVITGFFGRTEDGNITTFGRNGSDYTAAVVANAVNASSLEIWKDVEGFMTADPKFVSSARWIDRLSYYEAAELSYFGAKILHPRTVEPLINTDIPIYIRNIHKPKMVGTLICKSGYERKEIIKSVTYNKNIAVIKIEGAGVGYKPGIIGKLGGLLADAGINIYSVITSQTCINLLLDRNDSERSYQTIKALSGGVIENVEKIENIALIAVVGDGLLKTRGLAAKVFTAVAKEKVNVMMISAGASEVAYYFIVDEKDLKKTINAVHDAFFSRSYVD